MKIKTAIETFEHLAWKSDVFGSPSDGIYAQLLTTKDNYGIDLEFYSDTVSRSDLIDIFKNVRRAFKETIDYLKGEDTVDADSFGGPAHFSTSSSYCDDNWLQMNISDDISLTLSPSCDQTDLNDYDFGRAKVLKKAFEAARRQFKELIRLLNQNNA